MIIKQCKMLNEDQENRFQYFFEKYSLKKYYDPYQPSVFFSLWNYSSIKNHKSIAIIIWRGSDVVKMENILEKISFKKNIFHVAISSFIAKDLEKYKIKYKFIPIVGSNTVYFKSFIKGDEIYTYVPGTNPKKYNKRYGYDLIKKIQDKCKYKINIVDSPVRYTKEELVEIYKKCFCSLRFTKHDGLPNQVIEMGLMGRKSFYNGNIPGSIKWDEKNINKIIENIKKESDNIGTIDNNYSDIINKFINVGNDWLDTDYWTK